MSAGRPLPTVAEALAEELVAAGVDRIFGLPGGEVLGLIDATRARGIDFVLCRHEADAGLMAAVYGSLRGVPGVVVSTLGPGACNLLLPLANSRLDREPLVAISAQVPESWSASRIHQRLPLLDIFRGVVKFSAAIDAFTCRDHLRRALAEARTKPGGCAFLTLSADVGRAEAAGHGGEGSCAPSAPIFSAEQDRAALARIKEALFAARRPVLAIGVGADAAQAPLLRRWVAEWGLPVVVTPKVKGIIDETSAQFAGVVGGMAIDRVLVAGLERADLILGWGLDPTEIDGDWHERLPLLWVEDSPWATGVVPAARLLAADPARLLRSLLEEEQRPQWEDPLEETRRRRRELLLAGTSGPGYLAPTAVVRVLADQMPDDTIVATDVGSHKFLFGQFWPARHPQSFLMSNGLSGMGYGIPAAIGARLARPGQPVLAVVGDGGFSMNSQELETACRVGAPIVVVVLADASYSMIELSQRRKGLPLHGVRFGRIDSVRNAESCGAAGRRVDSEEELAQALAEALASGRPSVIEVPVRVDDYADLV